jgi:hypothetical protein
VRRLAILSAPLLLACSTGDNGRGSDTFSSMDATETSGDGDGDMGDGDGDPGDGDGESGDGDGDGDPGDGDGDTGDGDGDGDVCERFQHTYDFADDSWESQPLDLVWSGSSAPPCTVAPMAATYLEVWDQLLVWGDDGMFYRRIGGTWQPPEPIADRWGVVANMQLDSASHVPPVNGETSCGLIFTALPNAFLYQVFQDGGTSYDQSVPLMDEPPPGPPQSTAARNWALELSDPALWGQLDWWTAWQGFADGNVYRADANNMWMSWPEQDSPMFVNAPPGINPATIEAAWGSFELGRAYLIGP